MVLVVLIPEKGVQGGSTLGFSAGLQYTPEFKRSNAGDGIGMLARARESRQKA